MRCRLSWKSEGVLVEEQLRRGIRALEEERHKLPRWDPGEGGVLLGVGAAYGEFRSFRAHFDQLSDLHPSKT